jgi:valyl-tRNA synthetase
MFVDFKKLKSLSVTSWPEPNDELIDENLEKQGDIIMAIISETRREKAENRMPLNTPIKTLEISTKDDKIAKIIQEASCDLIGTLKIENLQINAKINNGKAVTEYPTIKFKTKF